jgi:hypothetical protein
LRAVSVSRRLRFRVVGDRSSSAVPATSTGPSIG